MFSFRNYIFLLQNRFCFITQQDIRAGDQLVQINGTPVEALKFLDIQNMLEHANSNQIHLTCIPYREPQPAPVVININQAESLPTLLSSVYLGERERGKIENKSFFFLCLFR